MIALAALLLSTPLVPQAEDAGRLIPADATVLVRFDSLSALADLGNAFARAAGETARLDAGQILTAMQCPLDVAALDLGRPVWFAVAIDAAAPVPSMTWVAAVKDAPAARQLEADLQGGPFEPVFQGEFVGFSMRPGYVAADQANPLLAAMAPGLVSVHVDLGRLMQAFGPILDMGMQQARMQAESAVLEQETGGFDLAPLMESYFDGIDMVLASAQSLSLAVEHRGDRLALTSSLLVRAGSPLDGWESDTRVDLAHLAGYLHEQDSIQMVGAWDWADFQRRFGSFVEAALEAYPDELATQLGAIWDEQVALAGELLPGVAASVRFGSQGIEGVYALRARDPAKVIARMGEILAGIEAPESAFSFEPLESLEAGERTATRWRMRMDWDAFARLAPEDSGKLREIFEKTYGKELQVGMVTAGEDLVVLFGSDSSVRNAFEHGAPGKPLRPALARLLERSGGGTPSFAYILDLGRLTSSIGELVAAVSPDEAVPMPQGPMELGYWFSVRGALWSGGIETDLEQLRGFVRELRDLDEGEGLEDEEDDR